VLQGFTVFASPKQNYPTDYSLSLVCSPSPEVVLDPKSHSMLVSYIIIPIPCHISYATNQSTPTKPEPTESTDSQMQITITRKGVRDVLLQIGRGTSTYIATWVRDI